MARLRAVPFRRAGEVAVLASMACVVALGILFAYGLAHSLWTDALDRERERGAVTAVGATLFAKAPYALVSPDPGMSAPGCLLPAGSVARSLGERDDAHVKVEVGSVAPAQGVAAEGAPATCAPGFAGYAELHGTWFVHHHD